VRQQAWLPIDTAEIRHDEHDGRTTGTTGGIGVFMVHLVPDGVKALGLGSELLGVRLGALGAGRRTC